jgi:hypothetical protein
VAVLQESEGAVIRDNDWPRFVWKLIRNANFFGGGGGGGDGGGGGGGDGGGGGEPAPSTGGDSGAAEAAAAAAGTAAAGGVGGPAGAAAEGAVTGALGAIGGDTSGDALSLAAAPAPAATGAGPAGTGAGGGGGGPGLADALGINDIAGAASSITAAQGVAPGTPSGNPGFSSPAGAISEGFDALAPQNGPAPATNQGAALNALQAGSLDAIGDLGTQGHVALTNAIAGVSPGAATGAAPGALDPSALTPGQMANAQAPLTGGLSPAPSDFAPFTQGVVTAFSTDPFAPIDPASFANVDIASKTATPLTGAVAPGDTPAPAPAPAPITTSQPGLVNGQPSIFGPSGPEQNLQTFHDAFNQPSPGPPATPGGGPGTGGNILTGGTGSGGGVVRRPPGGPQTVAGEGGIMLADGTIIPDPLSPAFNDVLAAPH